MLAGQKSGRVLKRICGHRDGDPPPGCGLRDRRVAGSRIDAGKQRARRPAPPHRAPRAPEKTLELAYISFAVANSYDAPMLAAAKAAATAGNANLTVFDGNIDPATQTQQLQDAITSGKYDGIVAAAGLRRRPRPRRAGSDRCGHRHRQHRPDPRRRQHDERSPRSKGARSTSCSSRARSDARSASWSLRHAPTPNPCNVGYIWSFKAVALDATLKAGVRRRRRRSSRTSRSSPRASRSTRRRAASPPPRTCSRRIRTCPSSRVRTRRSPAPSRRSRMRA